MFNKLKFNIMSKAGKKLFARVEKLGLSKRISKTRLWDVENATEIVDDIKDVTFDFCMSKEHESFFVTVKEGGQTLLVPFITGAASAEDIDIDDAELSPSGGSYIFKDAEAVFEQLGHDTVRIIEVTAMRDDEELNIAEGDVDVRAEFV